MKLSNKQADLLAREVVVKLEKQNAFKVPAESVKKLQGFKSYRAKLLAEKKKIETELSTLDESLFAITKTHNARPYHSIDDILREMRKGNTPRISDVADKIILKAMFADEQSLDDFVQSIVKEYTKKKSVTA